MDVMDQFDRRFQEQTGCRYVIGIDEAGRGPLAGPVVAAAVLLTSRDFHAPIRDSKMMTPGQRDRAFLEIQDKAHIGVGIMNEKIIDACNILQASFLAMNAAVRRLEMSLARHGLDARGACLLVDGNAFKSEVPYAYQTLTAGDRRSLSVACASVVAKVTRDRILLAYHQVFPQYGFDRHKGYPTAMHRQALKRYGPVFLHRRTFGGVRGLCAV